MELLPVFKSGSRALAAVSGGSDSVALLLLLNDMRKKGYIDLRAAHLNHRIRGSQADGDEAFVRELCQRLGVEAYFENIDVPALAASSSQGIETVARRARWEFLFRAKERFNCDVIATAHHMDDQAETVLMHLFRGGGLRGASGMSPDSRGVVRPLLKTGKAEILEFLRERGQDYREDSTNFDNDNPRNYLRNVVMPLVKTAYPASSRALSRFSEIAQAEDAYMRRACEGWMAENVYVTAYGFAMRPTGDEAILRRAVCEITKADYEGVARVISGARAGRPVELSGWRVEYADDCTYFIAADYRPSLRLCPLADGARLDGVGRARVFWDAEAVVSRDPWDQTLDADAVAGAVFRTRLPGDRMRPLGMTGVKKLKDVLIDRRVARAQRDFTPLLAKGNDILWIPGECISECARLTNRANRAVRLKWEREDMLPWRRKC